MTDLQDTLTGICDQLKTVAQQQAEDRDPTHDDFYTWGGALTELLDRVDEIAGVLGRQVAHYGDQRILRDDEGDDPARRLTDMTARLTELRGPLGQARERVREYHSAAAHIGVEVDPDAEVQW